jgi:hypothetical protein
VRSLAGCSRTSVACSSVWLGSFSAMFSGTSYTFRRSILAATTCSAGRAISASLTTTAEGHCLWSASAS